MKKFLVLALVLSVASLATAGITMASDKTTVNVGETFTITISGLVADLPMSGGLDGALEPSIKWTSADTTANVSGTSTLTDSFAGFGTLDFNINRGNSTVGLTSDGAWATATFVAGAAGEVYTFYLQNSSFARIPSSLVSVSVVPEPATMALLGLGALVLRRKK